MRKDVGRDNVLYIHVTLLPYLSASGELKTKPTQHSVRELRGMGIQPDIIGLRSDYPIDGDIRAKVALFCDVEREAVVPLTTADSIYEVPLMLEEAGMGDLVVEMLALQDKVHAPDLADWQQRHRTPQTPARHGQHRAGRQVRRAARRLYERPRGA